MGGYNLFQYISDLSLVKEQGLNGPIWALLALNCHPEYSFPKNPVCEGAEFGICAGEFPAAE